MLIEELSLHEFRNYAQLQLKFHPGLNILVGRNGSGKTNLLEAIHFLITGKTFKKLKQSELSRNQEKRFSIKLLLLDKGKAHEILLKYVHPKKKILWDQKPLRELRELSDKLKVIFFSAKDIDLILLSPSERRNFFDDMLATIKDEYADILADYKRLLQHRNRELTKNRKSTHWDKELIDNGHKLITMRISFLKAIAEPMRNLFTVLSGTPHFLPRISYSNDNQILTDSPIDMDLYIKKFEYYRSRDEYLGFTHYGPHSDDYFFYLKNQLSKSYSSQGENRLFVFTLKFTVNEYFKKVLHKEPLLILDDVFNDFDPQRLGLFYKYLEKQKQVLLACANDSLFAPYVKTSKTTEKKFAQTVHIKKVEEGRIVPWS